MLFNSTQFLIFFVLFCAGYAVTCRQLRLRNWLMVIASYAFYAEWDYRFTGLLFFTSTLDFTVGWLIGKSEREAPRRALLTISIILNLAVLATFKYFNFFQESLETLLNSLGLNVHWRGWHIVLPIGLSFYTFQSISYVVDVYRRQLTPCGNFIQFLAYDSFFPQLVAGPIGRGRHLLPQFSRTLAITVANLEEGLWLAIWGMFKKVVLADNLAPLVELVYQRAPASAPLLALGTIAFGLQIYCDFSGYSDIARGLARLLGFELGLNFNRPYFATSLRDFWQRWHISLSSWLRDYLYFPLGGSRCSKARTAFNLGLTMLLGGLWHGAALNFMLWGLWHSLGLIINHWWESGRSAGRNLPVWIGWLATQAFVLAGWVFFRAGSVDKLLELGSGLSNPWAPNWWPRYLGNLLVLAAPLVAMEFWQWRTGNLGAPLRASRWPRAVLQAGLLLLVICYWPREEAPPFIYFQF